MPPRRIPAVPVSHTLSAALSSPGSGDAGPLSPAGAGAVGPQLCLWRGCRLSPCSSPLLRDGAPSGGKEPGTRQERPSPLSRQSRSRPPLSRNVVRRHRPAGRGRCGTTWRARGGAPAGAAAPFSVVPVVRRFRRAGRGRGGAGRELPWRRRRRKRPAAGPGSCVPRCPSAAGSWQHVGGGVEEAVLQGEPGESTGDRLFRPPTATRGWSPFTYQRPLLSLR